MIEGLIRKNRSCRRYHQDRGVTLETLQELVDLARLSASAANLQPLRYVLVCDPRINEQIFACLGWAGYLQDWPGPEEGERPPAYIVILGDTAVAKDFGCDHGIAGQSILLGATEKGLAGCMIASINRSKLKSILNTPPQYEILLVLAIGAPKESIVLENVGIDGSIRYWRDAKGVHHVPKRSLKDVIVGCFEPDTS
ncbi:MAG: nitroreductase family protein [Pseudomonadota bacterium]